MPKPDHVECAKQARAIIEMTVAPFVPSDLSAAVSRANPHVGAMIEAAAAMICVSLKDGTGRVVAVR